MALQVRYTKSMQGVDPMVWQAARDFAERTRRMLGPRLKAVRMFGSQARGQARPGSDLDLLVLVDAHDYPLRLALAGVADEVMARTDFRVVPSPLVMTELEFANLKARERRLARDILQEGIPVLE